MLSNFFKKLDKYEFLGRGKMKKMMGPLLLGLGVKMMAMVPMIMGGLALLSTKALIIAKIAFVLSIIIFAQSFFSGTFRAVSMKKSK